MSVNVETAGPGPSLNSSATFEEKPNPQKGDQNSADRAASSLEDDWESNPANPRNWSMGKKWVATAILSLYTFVAPLSSSMMAPGLPEVATIYGITNPTILALTLSIFQLSLAFGPLFFSPISEMYGRTWILHTGNLMMIGFTLGCAYAPTAGVLIGLRFMSGLVGSAGVGIGGGGIADLFSPPERAPAMALYIMGVLFGPVVGPIAGGFITQALGIKWVFIILAIVCGVASVIGIPLLRETYAPVIRRRLAAKSGDPEKAAYYQPAIIRERGQMYYLWINLTRPFIMLFGSLICFVFSLHMAFVYGIYYLMFATFADIFANTYHFNTGIGGLAYLGLGVGFAVAFVFGSKTAQAIYKHLSDKNGGVGTPEMRLPALLFGTLFVPIGLFWYGWSAAAGIHFIMPILGTAIFSFGLLSIYLPVQLYMVDSFTYAASATSAVGFFRSLFGLLFPLFGEQMFAKLGLGGGNSLLAGLAILIGIPFPIWIYYKGEEMRARNPLTKGSVIKKKPSPETEPRT